MTEHAIGTREEWLAARLELLGQSLEAGKEGPLAEIAAGVGTDWAT